jgi:hypothetical protein
MIADIAKLIFFEKFDCNGNLIEKIADIIFVSFSLFLFSTKVLCLLIPK